MALNEITEGVMNSKMKARAKKVDLDGHVGLRGICALWIMIFHAFIYSKTPLDFQGSSIMPLFFILSGYTLSVAYAVEPDVVPEDEERGPLKEEGRHIPAVVADEFDIYRFHRNRFARVFPLYYICCLAAIPYWCAGYGGAAPYSFSFVASIVTSIIPLCTTFIFILGSCLDGPGWTVCTLAIMWLMFPYFRQKAHRMSKQKLVTWIVWLYWIQLVLAFVLFFLLVPFLSFWPAFCAATMHPLSRLPVFLMGVYAGELSNRCLYCRFPWRHGFLGLFPLPCCGLLQEIEMSPISDEERESDEKMWAVWVDQTSAALFGLTMAVFVLDTAVRYGAGGGGVLGALWLQAIVPYGHLLLVVASTRDGGRSWTSLHAFRTSMSQRLGQWSMAIYLVHMLAIYYICWIVHGGLVKYPDAMNCDDEYDEGSAAHAICEDEVNNYRDATTLPMWAIPIVGVVSVILAICLYVFIEEPGRKLLRI